MANKARVDLTRKFQRVCPQAYGFAAVMVSQGRWTHANVEDGMPVYEERYTSVGGPILEGKKVVAYVTDASGKSKRIVLFDPDQVRGAP
jgi:hypothetical protein